MIGIEEATSRGKKAYLDGQDMFNVPSYFNPKEKQCWIQGYEEEMHAETTKWLSEREEEEDVEDLDHNYEVHGDLYAEDAALYTE